MPKKKVIIQENGQEREVEMDVPESESHLSWGDPHQFRYLYQPAGIPRLDGPWKVTGSARYAADSNPITSPGLLFGRILRCPHAHAQIISIDIDGAKALPGVRAVRAIRSTDDKLLYQGDEVASVAAVSPDAAEDAIRAIKVEYDKLPHAVIEETAMAEGSPRVGSESNVTNRTDAKGDVDAAFKAADAIHEATYSVPGRHHVCLETHGVTAAWTGTDHLTVWASTQDVSGVQHDMAEQFKLPVDHVEVICDVMGGGFGSKFGMGVEGREAAELSKMARAPVRLLVTRKEEFLSLGSAPSAHARVKIGGKKDGTLTAYQADGFGTGGIGGAGINIPYIYNFAAHKVNYGDVRTNVGGSRAFRAPNHPQSSFLTELAIDEWAARLNLDPLEVRMKNDSNPVRQQEYRIGAERIGWARRRAPGAGTGPLKRGFGVASAQWWGGGSPSTTVRVTVHRDGSVLVESGTQDLGTGTRTYVGAIVAEEFHLPLNSVTARIGHSTYGPAGGSGGSVTTASVAPSVKGAAVSARQQLFAAAAPALKVKSDELVMGDGFVHVKDKPAQRLTWKQACALLGSSGVTGVVNGGNWPEELQHGGTAGCQFAEVEVDSRTGRVQVLRMVGVHDCGLVMNRKAVESQINGGMIMGVGLALMEGRIMDEPTGHMLNPNMEWYKIPGSMEIPDLVPIVFDNPTGKVTGIGEPPNIPGAAAIACAVYNALGIAVRDLPITPEKVMEALHPAAPA